jgi:hypothetical protein
VSEVKRKARADAIDWRSVAARISARVESCCGCSLSSVLTDREWAELLKAEPAEAAAGKDGER